MKSTLFVATVGGHVDELFELAPRYEVSSAARRWVTARSAQTEHLLRGEHVEWAAPITSRQWGRAIKAFPFAFRLIGRVKPHQMVSTGAAVAVPFALAARLRGVPVHYVESATRVRGPSLTGRILEWIPGVGLARQGAGWSRSGWSEVESVFAGFEAVERCRAPRKKLSVLVTFGTGPFEFSRGASAVMAALPESASVVWQRGATPEVGQWPGEVHEWMGYDDLCAAMEDSDVVITHAGVGSILSALRAGRRPIVLPRRAELGEVVDDHQVQLTADLQSRGLVFSGDFEPASLSVQLTMASTWGVQRTRATATPST